MSVMLVIAFYSAAGFADDTRLFGWKATCEFTKTLVGAFSPEAKNISTEAITKEKFILVFNSFKKKDALLREVGKDADPSKVNLVALNHLLYYYAKYIEEIRRLDERIEIMERRKHKVKEPCPTCKGKHPRGCITCGGKGWIWETVDPDKEDRKEAKSALKSIVSSTKDVQYIFIRFLEQSLNGNKLDYKLLEEALASIVADSKTEWKLLNIRIMPFSKDANREDNAPAKE
jgi:hypothetical protein